MRYVPCVLSEAGSRAAEGLDAAVRAILGARDIQVLRSEDWAFVEWREGIDYSRLSRTSHVVEALRAPGSGFRTLGAEEVSRVVGPPARTDWPEGTRVRVVRGAYRGLPGTVVDSSPTGVTLLAALRSRRLTLEYPFTHVEEAAP